MFVLHFIPTQASWHQGLLEKVGHFKIIQQGFVICPVHIWGLSRNYAYICPGLKKVKYKCPKINIIYHGCKMSESYVEKWMEWKKVSWGQDGI